MKKDYKEEKMVYFEYEESETSDMMKDFLALLVIALSGIVMILFM